MRSSRYSTALWSSPALAIPSAPDEVAGAVAAWVAAEARTELVLREMHSEWMDRVMEQIAERTMPSRRECTEPALFPA